MGAGVGTPKIDPISGAGAQWFSFMMHYWRAIFGDGFPGGEAGPSMSKRRLKEGAKGRF